MQAVGVGAVQLHRTALLRQGSKRRQRARGWESSELSEMLKARDKKRISKRTRGRAAEPVGCPAAWRRPAQDGSVATARQAAL